MQSGPIDPGVLGARLRQQSEIHDPITGAASPLEVEARSPLWPHHASWARIELMQVSEQGARRLEEYRFTPADGVSALPAYQGAGLPVALVLERGPSGASRARLYSARRLVAERASILPIDSTLTFERGTDDILARYFALLRAAQLEPTLQLFEADAYVQHSDGERFEGRERLRMDFARLYQSGGVELKFCNRTDDAARSVFEVCLPGNRAGLIVCERARSGQLNAVRLYS